LTLNVWTKPQVGESKKAVLVWIYGGGFTQGVTNVEYNNGQFFAEDGDVVVVSLKFVKLFRSRALFLSTNITFNPATALTS
jgi:cholinesterase